MRTLLLAASLALALLAHPALGQKIDDKAAPAAAAKAEPMDINSASEMELASLKGIGEVRAKAIVKARPYKGKDELVRKKIVPKGVYEDIKDQIIARQDGTATTAKKADKKK